MNGTAAQLFERGQCVRIDEHIACGRDSGVVTAMLALCAHAPRAARVHVGVAAPTTNLRPAAATTHTRPRATRAPAKAARTENVPPARGETAQVHRACRLGNRLLGRAHRRARLHYLLTRATRWLTCCRAPMWPAHVRLTAVLRCTTTACRRDTRASTAGRRNRLRNAPAPTHAAATTQRPRKSARRARPASWN